jgi:hypothetical protein
MALHASHLTLQSVASNKFLVTKVKKKGEAVIKMGNTSLDFSAIHPLAFLMQLQYSMVQ